MFVRSLDLRCERRKIFRDDRASQTDSRRCYEKEMKKDHEKIRFIENELFAWCKSAAFGRVLHFKEEMRGENQEKSDFYKGLRTVFDSFCKNDFKDDNFKNVVTLQERFEEVAQKYQKLLKSKQESLITVGMTQKFLNLYLKYKWCLGGPKPYHCPIDRQVLNEINWNNPRWSKFTGKDYKEAIEKLYEAFGKDLPMWELRFFNKKNRYYK